MVAPRVRAGPRNPTPAQMRATFRRAVAKPAQSSRVEPVASAVKPRRPRVRMRVPPIRLEMTPETAMKEKSEETCAFVSPHCETAKT